LRHSSISDSPPPRKPDPGHAQIANNCEMARIFCQLRRNADLLLNGIFPCFACPRLLHWRTFSPLLHVLHGDQVAATGFCDVQKFPRAVFQ
jgi:hypothetical protein